jgi:hypothetical protein
MSSDERQFVARARASLEARSQQLSPAQAGRLRAARRTALAGSRRHRYRIWLPATATAMVVALALLFTGLPRQDAEPPLSLAHNAFEQSAEDLEMLTRDEPLELYRDLDFYYWLAQEGGRAG